MYFLAKVMTIAKQRRLVTGFKKTHLISNIPGEERSIVQNFWVTYRAKDRAKLLGKGSSETLNFGQRIKNRWMKCLRKQLLDTFEGWQVNSLTATFCQI